MWEHENKLFVQVTVDKESILGTIAKAQSQMEELKQTISELKTAISFEEANCNVTDVCDKEKLQDC